MLPVTACQPPFGSSNKLAGGADSPRNPISAQTESDKGYYVNLRGDVAIDSACKIPLEFNANQ